MPQQKTAKHPSQLGGFVAAMLLAFTATTGWSATATITPAADTTLAQDFPDNSSGACDSLFAGNTDNGVGSARRALMRFDLSTIPPGSVINSVTLSMTVTRGSNHVDSIFTLHPVTSAWVEGTAGCGTRGGGQGAPTAGGGTTWNTMPGFGAASGSTLINNTSPGWSSASMAGDVQGWLDNPATNNGWILIGDETIPTSTRRFDSREGGSPPSLLVDFTPTGAVEACCESSGDCSLTVVGSGTCGGTTLTGVSTCDPNQCPQPSGACCNADNSCSGSIDKLVCEGAGGTFVGGNCNQADCGLAPFVEPLPIPAILQPTGTRADGVPQYTVSVQQTTQSVHPGLPDTTVWTYNGAWPASTFVAVKGQPIEVTYVNNLPTGGGSRGSNLLEVDTCSHGPNNWGKSKRIVTHLHGGHVPSRVDGQPEYHILPGETDVYEYPNNQDAATLWYHDHALGITRLNVYGGMAGFYLIADSEDTLGPGNAFGLPSGQYEIGMAIQDRSFNADGSLFYNAQLEDAFKGDYAVVNGKISPYLNVDQGKYRFRLLNGSQSRQYKLRLENITDPGNDPDFILVGTDLGLLGAPINLGKAFGGLQAPAERMDVVIDFSGFPAGTEIILRNDEQTPPLLPSIMKFIVTGQTGYTGNLSPTLRDVPAMPESSADGTRYFRLAKVTAPCSNDPGRTVNEWLVQSLTGPGGQVMAEHWDDLYEFPVLGTREIWEFENPTNSMHPMHVHLVRFQILGKTDMTTGQPIPLEPWEADTWKDIVRIPANTKARIIMDFEDYLGRFPQHCHLLDHEDHEMMRQFQTVNPPVSTCDDGNHTCDPGEDCKSCPSDCAQVSGAACGNGLCEGGDGENCLTCPADCAGKQSGAAAKMFCCGAPGGTNNIDCGIDVSDNRCIDSSAARFCRKSDSPRMSACCGDKLCEGAETITSCANDCDPTVCTPTEPAAEVSCSDGQDNDCDGLPDAADPDCQVCVPGETPELSCADNIDNDCDTLIDSNDPDCADTDNDGLPNGVETNTGIFLDPTHTGTNPGVSDTDGDGLDDGEEVNTYATDPTQSDSDGDLLPDGLEVANGSDPKDPASWPNLADGDVAPYGTPDGQLNAGDLTVAIRLALGLESTRALELAHCDLGTPDGIIDARDITLLIRMLLSP